MKELVRHSGGRVNRAGRETKHVRLVEDRTGFSDLYCPKVEPNGNFEISLGLGIFGIENNVSLTPTAVTAAVILRPPQEVAIQIGEKFAILGAEDQLLTFAADYMFDIVPLASAHQLHGAPAALQKSRLEDTALLRGQGKEVQRRRQEVRRKEPMAGTVIGAAEG